ncbi:hypothetical protein ABIA35_009489 [Catenulispora sp. MAP12-49]|uniref:hypothetical protein n=1 Tax=Catenulispora sp. MAP12-49 TaxID=3156302 RepID=UPI003512829F
MQALDHQRQESGHGDQEQVADGLIDQPVVIEYSATGFDLVDLRIRSVVVAVRLV